MLVLTVAEGERIFINGEEIVITCQKSRGKRIKLGFEADPRISIKRERVREKQQQASADELRASAGV